MSDASRRLPPKKEVALALLEASSLFIHLDPRRTGVTVPKWLMGQPQLVLQVGLNMAIQIPDLTVDDDGVTCTLSFNRSRFWCKLPWSAVYALVGEDGRGMIWPDDVPPEVALQMQKAQQPQPAAATPTPAPALAPKAQAARKGKTKLSAVSAADSPKSTRPRSRPEAAPKPSSPAIVDDAEAKPVDPDRSPARPRRAPVGVPALASRRDEASDRPTVEPEKKPSAPPARDPGPRKPRRELPPYLRVVK